MRQLRVADFILANIEPIVVEWEAFARSIAPGAKMNNLALRDHAVDILCATAHDMESAQTSNQQSEKSKGRGDGGDESRRLNGASEIHAVGRVHSGFDLLQVVAEYRALRASVIRLWRNSGPAPVLHDIDDLTRFNESMDQSLSKAVHAYTSQVDRSRQLFLAILGHDLRNPLNSMTMSAEALTLSGQLDDELSQMAAQISAGAVAMARLISDLLDFTGAGLGAVMPLSPVPIDLGRLCRNVVEEMRTGD